MLDVFTYVVHFFLQLLSFSLQLNRPRFHSLALELELCLQRVQTSTRQALLPIGGKKGEKDLPLFNETNPLCQITCKQNNLTERSRLKTQNKDD